MSRRIVIGQSDIPAKLNTQRLAAAIASSAGVEVSRVAISYFGPGTEEVKLESGSIEVREIAPSLIVYVPDDVAPITVLNTVAAHAPEQDDGEEAVAAKSLQKRAELREYLLEFLQDPDLIALLKNALRD